VTRDTAHAQNGGAARLGTRDKSPGTGVEDLLIMYDVYMCTLYCICAVLDILAIFAWGGQWMLFWYNRGGMSSGVYFTPTALKQLLNKSSSIPVDHTYRTVDI
jgi:hypothetical protein